MNHVIIVYRFLCSLSRFVSLMTVYVFMASAQQMPANTWTNPYFLNKNENQTFPTLLIDDDQLPIRENDVALL